MGEKSNVEKAAWVWHLLDCKAKALPAGEEKTIAIKARHNALRTLGIAVKAAESLELARDAPAANAGERER